MDDASAPAASALAVVGLSGAVLRYAEVVREDGGRRLRRLGAVDFEVDAEAAVFEAGDPAALADVEAALGEVLAGHQAEALVVAAHPAVTTTFFTPLPAGLGADARDAQLHQEAALLADVAPTQAVRVKAVPVRTETVAGGDRAWYHSLHVPEAVHARLARLAEAAGTQGYDLADATRAVARLVPADGLVLAVGAYAGHTEVAVVRDGAFLFGTHGAGTTPADTAYFALAALRQAGLEAAPVGDLRTYGDAADSERLSLLFEFVGAQPVPLDPFVPYGRRPDGAPAVLASLAPVLGAAL
ncbi:MAG: hypothetical protein AAF845_19800 [Bacteroidota bacterium]